jgi:hypothetical protein
MMQTQKCAPNEYVLNIKKKLDEQEKARIQAMVIARTKLKVEDTKKVDERIANLAKSFTKRRKDIKEAKQKKETKTSEPSFFKKASNLIKIVQENKEKEKENEMKRKEVQLKKDAKVGAMLREKTERAEIENANKEIIRKRNTERKLKKRVVTDENENGN